MRLNTDLLAFESCAAVFHRSHYRELIEFLLVAFAVYFLSLFWSWLRYRLIIVLLVVMLS